MIWFLLKFSIIILGYYSLSAFSFFTDLLLELAELGAITSSALLNIFGEESNHYANTLFTATNSLKVSVGCDGSEPIVYLLAGIIAYPAFLKYKIIGFVIGAIVLFFVNVARIISLFYINGYYQEYFNIVHNEAMPFFTLLSSGAIFYGWMRIVNKYNKK